MRTPSEIANDYLAAWNEADDALRLERMEGWAADAAYRDPLMQAESRGGIAGMIAGARSRFPGHSFTLRGTPDGHGAFARFSWMLAAEGGTPVGGGTDIVRLDGEGRIAEVIGFLDATAA